MPDVPTLYLRRFEVKAVQRISNEPPAVKAQCPDLSLQLSNAGTPE
jgi:hypothetical protein